MSTSPTLVDSPAEQSEQHTAAVPVAVDNIQFPRSAFVGLGGDFVEIYRGRLESPPEFLFGSWHACLGAAISPYVRLNSVLDLPPRIYAVNLGTSAVPRKSTSIKVALKSWQSPSFFVGNQSENPYFRVEMGLGSVEGFVRVFNGWSRKENEVGGDPRPTLVVYDELRSFVEKAKQKGSTLLPFLTSMFEGEDYDNTTVNRPVSVRGCHIGLVGACTLDTFADMWSSEFTSIGFPNRLFLIKGDPQNRIPLPEYPPTSVTDSFNQNLSRLLSTAKQRHQDGKGRIALSPQASQRWDDYYRNSMTRSIHSSRLDTYAFKWMMLLAVSQDEFEISVSSVDRAIDLIEYQLRVRKLYDPIDADNKYAQMEEKIRRHLRSKPGQFVKRRDLANATNSYRDGVYMFNAGLANLIASQEIQPNGAKNEWMWIGE